MINYTNTIPATTLKYKIHTPNTLTTSYIIKNAALEGLSHVLLLIRSKPKKVAEKHPRGLKSQILA